MKMAMLSLMQSGRQFASLQHSLLTLTSSPSPTFPKPGPNRHARRCISSGTFHWSGLQLFKSLSPWHPSFPFVSGSTRLITPSAVCYMMRPLHVPPPPISHASTPSSLGPSHPPACIGPPWCAPPHGTPASTLDLPPPSNSPRRAPPRGSPASSLADLPPSTAPSSTVGHHPPSPRHVALKSSQRDPKPPPPVAKGKSRREPSPEQVEKRVRSAECNGLAPFVRLGPLKSLKSTKYQHQTQRRQC